MRNTPNLKAERYRIKHGVLGSHAELGNYGAFLIPQKDQPDLCCIVSEGSDPSLSPELQGWEHVSVSTRTRCPTWLEMCLVKELFWKDDETVMQLHPPKADWINNHPFTLHLWRHRELEIPRPPGVLVGIQGLQL